MHRSFEVTVLGTSSASPTKTRHPSGQLVRLEGDYFLIDCGEGTQLQLVKLGLRMHRIRYILISHMHGDHFYGLPGLISSMALFGRTEKLTIAGPAPLQGLLENIFQITESRVPFEIEYLITNPAVPQQILANGKWSIKTVPLQHRIDCTGFVIEERGPELRLNVSVCEAMGVPVKQYENIKWGGDWIKDDGSIVSNKVLTLPGNPNRSYAYISDTIYDETLIEHIQNVSLLYHEATFLHDLLKRAEETHHSTALQAGQIATLGGVKKLIIGHFSGRYSHTDDLLREARDKFVESYIAEEGRTYQVG
jgi:ribonuclease Z